MMPMRRTEMRAARRRRRRKRWPRLRKMRRRRRRRQQKVVALGFMETALGSGAAAVCRLQLSPSNSSCVRACLTFRPPRHWLHARPRPRWLARGRQSSAGCAGRKQRSIVTAAATTRPRRRCRLGQDRKMFSMPMGNSWSRQTVLSVAATMRRRRRRRKRREDPQSWSRFRRHAGQSSVAPWQSLPPAAPGPWTSRRRSVA
mmetsp:Transcript_85240/g.264897  ORF Transcript_85240/g.264897 Transcript_85240/m.264897 type:complete len:201 (-) Transcript_85240:180-782(-)